MTSSSLPLALAGLLCAAALGGCGGGGTGGSSVAQPGPAAPPAPQAPTISTQPADASAAPAGKTTFSVVASGSGDLSYQWSRNGEPIPGATAPTLTIEPGLEEPTHLHSGAVYRVTVKNAHGEVRSLPAMLKLSGPGPRLLAGAFDQRFERQVRSPYWFEAVAVAGTRGIYIANQFQTQDILAVPGTAFTLVKPEAACGRANAMAADRAGTLYIACDTAVLKIGTDNVTTVLAGSLSPSDRGYVDGVGAAARFFWLEAIAVDARGSIVVADPGNKALRRISPDGTVRTEVLVSGVAGGTGGPDFSYITHLAFDANGVLFIADATSIGKVGASGVVTTVAGSPSIGGFADNAGFADGAGGAARFRGIGGMAFDSKGNLFISDGGNRSMRKMTPDGQVTTFAGRPETAGAADGRGRAATFDVPGALSIDANDRLYVTDRYYSLRTVSPDADVLTVLGSAAVARSAGHIDGIGQEARFDRPLGLAADTAGNLFVADSRNNAIRKVTPDGAVSTLATSGPYPAEGALLIGPTKLAAARDGTIYAITVDRTVRIGTDGKVSELPAPVYTDFVSGGRIMELAVDSGGNLYQTVDQSRLAPGCDNVKECPYEIRYALRKIAPDGTVTDWRGPGPAAMAGFRPGAMAADKAGNLIVAEFASAAIWKISADGTWSYFANQKIAPAGPMDIDASGNLYMLATTDTTASIVKVTPQGVRSIVAGDGFTSPNNGLLNPYSSVRGLAFGSGGRLYTTQGDALVEVVLP